MWRGILLLGSESYADEVEEMLHEALMSKCNFNEKDTLKFDEMSGANVWVPDSVTEDEGTGFSCAELVLPSGVSGSCLLA